MYLSRLLPIHPQLQTLNVYIITDLGGILGIEILNLISVEQFGNLAWENLLLETEMN